MNSNTNNSEKINNLTEQDEEFFAQHPQPTLEQARAFQAAFQAEEEDDEDLLSIMSDVEIDEDYEDEDEGMFNCDHDCCCFRCIAQAPLSRAPQICFVPDGEELVGDIDLDDEDQYLYNLKRYNRYPNKSLKIYHEHEPIPMDISDDEYKEQEDGEQEDGEQEDCEQEDGGQDGEDEEWPVNIIIDDVIPMDIDENENVRPQLKYQRQTSCWEQNGEIVYNGNPDGSRLYDEVEDDLADLPDLLTEEEYLAQELAAALALAEAQDLEHDLLDDYHENVCALHYLEEALGRGENLDRWEAERVLELRRDIAYYETRH
jgi:hypothetical protein